MFKIFEGVDIINAEDLFSKMDSDRTKGHSLSEKKRIIVQMVIRQGSFTHRLVNAWNGLFARVEQSRQSIQLPPPPKVGRGYVFTPVCLSLCLFVVLCLSVNRISQKVVDGFV